MSGYFHSSGFILTITIVAVLFTAWTLATAAIRGRWGWFLLTLMVPVTAFFFWAVNPPPTRSSPASSP